MIGGIQIVLYIKNMDIELYMMLLVTSMPKSQLSSVLQVTRKELDLETCKIRKFSEPTKQAWFSGIGRGRKANMDSLLLEIG